jgi:HSP20 family protein
MLVRWTPWNEMQRLSREFDKAFGFGPATGTGHGDAWLVPFDVSEDADKLVLVADLPGVDQKDLDIQVEQNILTLKGQRKIEREAKPEGDFYRRFERQAGAFVRTFKVPPTVDAEKISASLKDGVLTLALPKKPEAQPRQIKISVQ